MLFVRNNWTEIKRRKNSSVYSAIWRSALTHTHTRSHQVRHTLLQRQRNERKKGKTINANWNGQSELHRNGRKSKNKMPIAFGRLFTRRTKGHRVKPQKIATKKQKETNFCTEFKTTANFITLRLAHFSFSFSFRFVLVLWVSLSICALKCCRGCCCCRAVPIIFFLNLFVQSNSEYMQIYTEKWCGNKWQAVTGSRFSARCIAHWCKWHPFCCSAYDNGSVWMRNCIFYFRFCKGQCDAARSPECSVIDRSMNSKIWMTNFCRGPLSHSGWHMFAQLWIVSSFILFLNAQIKQLSNIQSMACSK